MYELVTMLSMLLNVFQGKKAEKKPEEKSPAEEVTKKSEWNSFIKSSAAKTCIKECNNKILKKTGITGVSLVTDIMRLAHRQPDIKSDEDIVKTTNEIVDKFVGGARLENIIAARFKAMPEKIMKDIKSIVGGKGKSKKAA